MPQRDPASGCGGVDAWAEAEEKEQTRFTDETEVGLAEKAKAGNGKALSVA